MSSSSSSSSSFNADAGIALEGSQNYYKSCTDRNDHLPCFHSLQQCLIPRRLRTPRLRIHNTKLSVPIHIRRQLHRAVFMSLPNKRLALRRGPRRGVRNRQEREHRAKDDRRVARARNGSRVALERVALLVRVVPDGGHDEVRAVCCDHARLDEPRARVVLLDRRVDAHDRDDDDEHEVERDEESVERAPRACKERIEHARERDGRGVPNAGRADQDPLPEIRLGALPVLEACFGPRVREVDEEHESQKDEDCGADHGNVVAPEHEEAVRDEERGCYENEP